MNPYIRVIDFETSGDIGEGEVIEIGWADLTHGGYIIPYRPTLIRPTRPISIETMAVHHLRESDLKHGISREEAFAELLHIPAPRDLLGDVNVAFAAHSAKFEQSWWPELHPNNPWICTYKCALRIWPEAPRHSNQVLRYFLGLDLPPSLAMPPHRAAPDAFVTAHILKKLLQQADVEQLIRWSSEPALLRKVGFGKYVGMAWTDVDDGYLRWILSQDFDEDVVHTVRHEMARRRGDAGCDAEARAA
jgi:exodeoxyribonuclease X